MAVSLSVTANFATDGIKFVIDKLTDEGKAEVVYCRNPDGEEIPIDQLKQIAADPNKDAAP